MPVMKQRSFDAAEVAAKVPDRAVLAFQKDAAITGRDARIEDLLHFAQKGAGHEPIGLADDGAIEQAADGIEGAAAHGPGITGMMVVGDPRRPRGRRSAVVPGACKPRNPLAVTVSERTVAREAMMVRPQVVC